MRIVSKPFKELPRRLAARNPAQLLCRRHCLLCEHEAEQVRIDLFSAKHAVVKSQGRDTFSVVNVSTGTTLVRKILKAGAISEVVTNSSDSTHVVDPQANAMERGESQTKHSDACKESDGSDDEATQYNSDVTTRSGRVVKSTKDSDNLVYFLI